MDKTNPENSSPSFFKIFLDESASNLRLPPAFVKKLQLEGKFPQNPVLKIQTGQKWRVEIETSGERACFGKGWLDFVKDTKIKFGDFLVFRLIANSNFKVFIFDPNGCQKDLSSASKSCSHSGSRITDADLKNTIEIEEEEDDDVDHEVDGENDIELQPVKGKKKSVKPCFRKVLKSFNVYAVDLPSQFLLESGLRKAGRVILRNKSGREWPVKLKTWTTRYNHRVYISHGWVDYRKANKLMEGDTCLFEYFHGGQNGFIQVEVVKKAARKSKKPLWNQVSRKRGRPPQIHPGKRSRISDTDLKNTIKIEEDDDDDEVDGEKVIELQPVKGKKKSVKPCFRKVLTSSNAYSVVLPSQFLLESGLKKAGKIILRNKSGREWPVTVKKWTRNYGHRVYISHGWRDFRRENKLMEGDTCLFQYFHGGQNGFIQVEVVKKAARKSEKPLWNQVTRKRGRPPLIRPGKRSRISDTDLKNTIKIEEEDDDDEVNGEKDIEFQPVKGKKKSVKPCFRKVLTSFNAYSVDLPSQFLRDSGLRKAGEVILRNKSGREWPVMIVTNQRNRVLISHGWADFRRENNLMEGDNCSFQYFHGDNEASQSGFIQVEVVKKAARKSGRHPWIQAPRKRGRPPQICRGKR